MRLVKPDISRFFDGGSLDGNEPPQPGVQPSVELKRVLVTEPRRWWQVGSGGRGTESFTLRRRIAYRARWHTTDEDLVILVPARSAAGDRTDDVFRTDLTSVPNVFTWLVPRTGLHLPAAIVHDGLIYDPNEPASYGASEPVPRMEADRIFRDGMADLGTGFWRRWLMWAAVSLATVKAGVSSVSPPGETSGAGETYPLQAYGGASRDRYYRSAVFGTLALIFALGVLATLDIWDIWNILPWMGSEGFWREFGLGLVFAFIIPVLLAPLWARLWIAGLFAGWAFAVLFWVTLLLALLTLGFQLLEILSRLARPHRLLERVGARRI